MFALARKNSRWTLLMMMRIGRHWSRSVLGDGIRDGKPDGTGEKLLHHALLEGAESCRVGAPAPSTSASMSVEDSWRWPAVAPRVGVAEVIRMLAGHRCYADRGVRWIQPRGPSRACCIHEHHQTNGRTENRGSHRSRFADEATAKPWFVSKQAFDASRSVKERW